MKHNKLIIALSLALLSPIAAATDANGYDSIYFYDNAYDGKVFLDRSDTERYERLAQYSKEDKDNLLASLQELATLHTSYEVDRVESAILDIMASMHPELKVKWDHIVHIDGKKIYQDDHTIHHEQVDNDYTTPKENRVRLSEGLAPVSYDGKPIKLCSLTRAPDSSYFELLDTQAKAFINLSQSGLSVEQGCINENESSAYWKSRNSDLVNERADYTDRYHYE